MELEAATLSCDGDEQRRGAKKEELQQLVRYSVRLIVFV